MENNVREKLKNKVPRYTSGRRPSTEKAPKTLISIYLLPEKAQALKKLCSEWDCSMSKLIETMVDDILTEHRAFTAFRFKCDCGYSAGMRSLYRKHVKENPTHKIIEFQGGEDVVQEEQARQAAMGK